MSKNLVNKVEVIKAPFQYAGSKHEVFRHIKPIVQNKHWDNYYEPFCGSMSVGLSLINMDIADNYYLSDKSSIIIDIWKDIRDKPDEVIDGVKGIFEHIESNLPSMKEAKLMDESVFKAMTREYFDKYLLDLFNNGGEYCKTAYFIVAMKVGANHTVNMKDGILKMAVFSNDHSHYGEWVNVRKSLIYERIKTCSDLLNRDNVHLDVKVFSHVKDQVDDSKDHNLFYNDPPYENSSVDYGMGWDETMSAEIIYAICELGLKPNNSMICSNSLVSVRSNKILDVMFNKYNWLSSLTNVKNRTQSVRKRDAGYKEAFYYVNII